MSHTHLDDPSLRSALRAMVRRRVPAADVDDVVQATLTEAVAARRLPDDREQLRRWVFGIARHKIVDAHRARRREVLEEHDASVAAVADEELEASSLLHWAERELPSGADARSTLGLMLREGDGERLEHLAADARLPAATVRQRVSRLRQHFRTRWALQVAALLVLVLGGLLLYAAFSGRHEMAIHPVVGTAPSMEIGGPTPSTSGLVPPSVPSTTASAAPSTQASTSAERPVEKMAPPPSPAPTPPSKPPQKAAPKDERSQKAAPIEFQEKPQTAFTNAPVDVDSQATAPSELGAKKGRPPSKAKSK